MIERCSVLYVDDDVDDRDLFHECLFEAVPDCELHIAPDGMHALLMLQKLSSLPDVIFLDVNMPIMTGLEVLKKIKSHVKFQNIPVYFLSTSNNPDVAEQSKKLGAADYLIKPTTYESMRRLLRGILEEVK